MIQEIKKAMLCYMVHCHELVFSYDNTFLYSIQDEKQLASMDNRDLLRVVEAKHSLSVGLSPMKVVLAQWMVEYVANQFGMHNH